MTNRFPFSFRETSIKQLLVLDNRFDLLPVYYTTVSTDHVLPEEKHRFFTLRVSNLFVRAKSYKMWRFLQLEPERLFFFLNSFLMSFQESKCYRQTCKNCELQNFATRQTFSGSSFRDKQNEW